MEKRKYEFNGETMTTDDGKVLHRIVATEDFGDVKAGDVGGWVESYENLSGSAWVYGEARVYGEAWVSGSARVSGSAWVFGEARVCDSADLISFSGFGSCGRTTTVFKCEDGELRVVCGCFYGTVEEFAKKVEETHGDSLYGREYKAIIEVIKVHFEDFLQEKSAKTIAE